MENSKLEKFLRKLLNKVGSKYQKSASVFSMFRINNHEYFHKHLFKSGLYFLRLIRAERKGKNLMLVKTPVKVYSPIITEVSDKATYDFTDCKAIPDSQLLSRKSPEELVEVLKDYDVISFDIFDTCIFRPYAKPSDLFYLLENKFKCFNFCELRVQAEQKARQKKANNNYEVDVYEIYEELSKLCFLTKKDADVEIATELEMCYANAYMLEVFKLLHELNKKIIIVSDMYLPSKVLSEILEKNGFTDFEKIYVSCEQGINKASGKLFDFPKNDYPNQKIIHIGDNYSADIQGGKKAKIDVYHYQQCNEFGNQYRPITLVSPVSSMYKGVVNNYMYNGMNKNKAREDFGFIYGGPIVTGFNERINQFARNNNVDKILFMARDMDIFYKAYNKYYKEFENEYVRTSRFSLQEIIFEDYPAEYFHHTIKARCDRGYTIKQAFNEIDLDILLDSLSDYKLKPTDIIVAKNIYLLEQLFVDNKQKIVDHFKPHQMAAKEYFKKVIGKAKVICAVDLGWRGSILGYLKTLLVDKWHLCDEIKGVLFGNTISNTSVNLVSEGIVTAYAYNHITNRDFLRNTCWEKEYINLLILESLFTSEEASLLQYKFKENSKQLDLVYGCKNDNAEYIAQFQTGMLKFVEEFEKHRGKYRQFYPMSAVDAFESMYNIAGQYDYVARIIGDIVDTPYAIAGLNIKNNKFVPLGQLMIDRQLIKTWPIV